MVKLWFHSDSGKTYGFWFESKVVHCGELHYQNILTFPITESRVSPSAHTSPQRTYRYLNRHYMRPLRLRQVLGSDKMVQQSTI